MTDQDQKDITSQRLELIAAKDSRNFAKEYYEWEEREYGETQWRCMADDEGDQLRSFNQQTEAGL